MVVKEKKTILNLGYAQIWTVITIIAGLLGTMYAAGIKTETEIKKYELMKQAQKYEDQISVIKVELREVVADSTFFKSQYIKTHERLTECLKNDSEESFYKKSETVVPSLVLQRNKVKAKN